MTDPSNPDLVEQLAEKYGFVDCKLIGGRRVRFSCNHASCTGNGCDCSCHGEDPGNPRRLERKTNPDFSAAIREAISVTRRETLEQAIQVAEEVEREESELVAEFRKFRLGIAGDALERQLSANSVKNRIRRLGENK